MHGAANRLSQMVPYPWWCDPLLLVSSVVSLPPAKGAPSPPPLPRSGGQLWPSSHAGTSQLRPAGLRARPNNSALSQERTASFLLQGRVAAGLGDHDRACRLLTQVRWRGSGRGPPLPGSRPPRRRRCTHPSARRRGGVPLSSTVLAGGPVRSGGCGKVRMGEGGPDRLKPPPRPGGRHPSGAGNSLSP